MKRIYIQLMLLLFATIHFSVARAWPSNSSASSSTSHSTANQTALPYPNSNHGNFSSYNRASGSLPRMSLPFVRTHVVYTQTRNAPVVDNGPNHAFVYISHVSGKGTPQQILNQYQEKHQSMMNQGFGPPEIVGQHHFEMNAERQVTKLQYAVGNKPGHIVEYFTPAQEEVVEGRIRKAVEEGRLGKAMWSKQPSPNFVVNSPRLVH